MLVCRMDKFPVQVTKTVLGFKVVFVGEVAAGGREVEVNLGGPGVEVDGADSLACGRGDSDVRFGGEG